MNIRLILKLAAIAGVMTAISLWVGQLAYTWMPVPASEEALLVDGDFADLTPVVREDILLALPTNPLCGPDCRGLKPKGQPRELQVREQAEPNTAWSALDNLKL